MTVTFSGLSSGLDTGAMIDQLVAAEKAPAATLTNTRNALGRQKNVVTDLTTKLAALAGLSRGLDLASEIRSRTAVASDTHAGIAVSGAANAGSHAIRIAQLASAQVSASRTFATGGAGTLAAGSVDITVGGTTSTVAWTAADSLSDIADRLSATAGINASVLYDGTSYRLVVSATASGTAGAATFVDGGDSLLLGIPSATKVPARDLLMSIDGIDITRPTNVVSDALPGMTITAKTVHTAAEPDTTLGIADDVTAVTDRVQKLVDAYNAVAKAMDGQLRYDGTAKGQDTLFGDSTLRRLQSAMASTMSQVYGGKTLSEIGIKSDRTGTLVFDAAKLKDALATDPTAVEAIFATGGLASALTVIADDYSRSGDGVFAAKTKALTARQDVYTRQIAAIERRAEALGTQLLNQFTALEKAMSSMQNQFSYLTGLTG